jgi:calcium-translocating P-type ATPase
LIDRKTIEQLYRELKTSSEGLSQEEAASRLQKYGQNAIKSENRLIFLRNLAAQFTDFLVIILIIAGVLSLILGDIRTADVMFAVVILNAAIGFWQQFKTEKTLAALKQLLPHRSQVMRDGKQKEILSKYVVPGDILILQAGDSIPADGRIIELYSFKTNEAALTGESNPQNKHPHVDEKHPYADVVFTGTNVLEGEAKILVTETGVETEFGKIAEQTKTTKEELSPLQKRLRQVGRTVAIIAVTIMIGIIAYELIKIRVIDGKAIEPSFFREIFLFALGLAAALVPEGLPATVSVALSIGANRLIKKKAVVRKLASVETLGSTEVICTDKTGTLTEGKMAVMTVFSAKQNNLLNIKDYDLKSDVNMLLNWIHCGNVKETDKGLTGDPNEVAIYQAVLDKGIEIKKEITEHKKVHEVSFNSIRKMMSVTVERDNKFIVYAKGAAGVIIEKSVISDADKKKHIAEVDKLARMGFRVLSFGHRKFNTNPKDKKPAEIESNLEFDGFVGVEDKIRPEVPEAIRYCHRAGISIVMVTGDYKLTAESVANEIKIAPDNKYRMISGDELDKMPDLKLRENLLYPCVFYQTDPQSKLKIVETLQQMGKIVAVTGDGVNDALALKKADIGVAMGIGGTDVAKEASSMVLLDDNFATIVNAVKEGRIIWDNLKKFLFYVFASNAGEFMTVFFGLIFAIPNPILAVQILSVDLGTDVLPSLALAADPAEQDVLKRPAQGKKKPLLSADILIRLLYVGIIMGGGAALNFWLINGNGPDGTAIYQTATAAAFATLVVCQIVNVFEVREFRTFREAFLDNKYLILSVLAEILILIGVVYFPPLQNFLSTKPLDLIQWSGIIAVGAIFLVAEEIRKHFSIKNMQVKIVNSEK